jgi:hypothetical protein
MTEPGPALIITIAALRGRPGAYSAHVDGRVVCRSRQPLLDAARHLLAAGHDPATPLVLRHARSDIDCLRATIGIAAKLTVEESAHGPVFRRHRTASPSAVEAPRITRRNISDAPHPEPAGAALGGGRQ